MNGYVLTVYVKRYLVIGLPELRSLFIQAILIEMVTEPNMRV